MLVRTNSLSRSILDLLKEQHLLSANQIQQHFEKKGHLYNKTSVYRALNQLLTEEVICRYDFNDKEAQYELRKEHHDHIVCEVCGKIEAADCQYTQPKSMNNFQMSHHHLTLFGVCDTCRTTEQILLREV